MRYPLVPLLLLLISFSLQAQEFDASLQLRPRYEFRNGFKSLLDDQQDPASFVSQRSRLNLNFKNEALQLRFSLQNIRVWGDVPTITAADNNGIGVFEAYAEYHASPKFFVRLGRQVLNYDNQRILGGLDWAQQGQSHDALLLNFSPAQNQRLHFAFALNEDGENLISTPYTVNNYKNMQMAHYNVQFGESALSLLFLNNGYETAITDLEREVQYLQTFGTYFNFLKNRWGGDISLYGQTGERNNRNVMAYYAGGNLSYNFTHAWTAGIGAEYLSGTDFSEDPAENNSFTPLFGTNHAFNGLMDYFYVGNHLNSVGLQDFYGKLSYRVRNAELSVMPHLFYSAAPIVDINNNRLDSFLGTEIDFVGTHKIRRDLSGSLGYSQMFGSSSMEFLKGGDASRVQNWVWVMISFHPQIFSSSQSLTAN